jgi:uncharacterized protein
MEILILCIAALITSLLTFFSGFGLGTILTPLFAIFFPIEMAIALTGVVHFLNNIFKLMLIGKHADKQVVIRFGIPAVFAALLGAFLLLQISDLKPIHTYAIGNKLFHITPIKLIVAILIIFFSVMEIVPRLKKIQFEKDKLFIGGLLSGFFGGLSGNQGALRTAFLIKSGLSKEAFIATGIVIACLIDFTRIGVYSIRFLKSGLQENLPLVITATLSAFIGAYLGSRLLKSVTFSTIQIVVTVFLVMLSLGIGSGLI